ncbi:MAG TPA: acyl carrier protein [Bryobacteraceae bacterium]|nr:acyl carrier protein [Bryobacteraceae bacterium]
MISQSVKSAIHQKIAELAGELGHNASGLRDDQVVIETGLLDSAAILELMVWMEGEFGIEIDPENVTVDNFGSIEQMTAFVETRRAD